ncbi:6-phosphogluconate dehydrogenase C-terminal domain family protein [Babesia bovis T2Bo]|uniref:phosphogluconate dehydrogenase (NADP(+)-dependent, decarboxylating) n=1 Tax=Babesia bovis TaxID=5865 RepID=A7AQE8_BABBO|nr:6-phosphogluconate dehydrogenase C-terminal domain family protein [Babesia bovis T2Bo]EDO06767.1 6-phosphogluconate dehydrogenase C-terminal domain family protein [Babesia bovis T2Bo]|eukprot:XP_001610335.1 6-phosphogluconate dehydrogenase [Babesia bovis T2Bo]
MASEFGVIGLGVMGGAYTQNLTSRGIRVSAFSIQQSEIDKMESLRIPNLQLFTNFGEYIESLEKPRKILMLVTAGKAVDQVLNCILGLLEVGDIVIDGGNEWYENTIGRIERCKQKGVHFCAMGVSGGERGARISPCIMFSGERTVYDMVKQYIEQDGRSFYVGPGASGHYVKMVHNGIEYAMMQALSEIYMIMSNILELELDTIGNILGEWCEGEVGSFLLKITSIILQEKTNEENVYLLDKIVDQSGANGTGKWTVKEALDLAVPVPTISAAVEMRNASNVNRSSHIIPNRQIKEGHNISEEDLKRTLHGCMIASIAQGTALLMEAAKKFAWDLNMEQICNIWSKDAIISCTLLTKLSTIFSTLTPGTNVLYHDSIRAIIGETMESWRKVCKTCINYNMPAPAMTTGLQYVQTLSSEKLGHNLIQAQRDYFGAHCFTLIDIPGKHHHNWYK